jgi:hypothetical protein
MPRRRSTIINVEDYTDGPVYKKGLGPDGGFFKSPHHLYVYCDEHQELLPRLVYACRPLATLIHAETVLEISLGCDYDIARQKISQEWVDELQELLDKKLMELADVAYEADFETKVRFHFP